MKNVSKRFKIKELKNSERKTEYVMEVKIKAKIGHCPGRCEVY